MNNLKKSGSWTVHLTIANKVISSIDNNEECVMHRKIMAKNEPGEFVKEQMKGSKFVFDYVQLLYHKCHKIHSNHGGSYIDYLDWIKSKKATINPINKKIVNAFKTQ